MGGTIDHLYRPGKGNTYFHAVARMPLCQSRQRKTGGGAGLRGIENATPRPRQKGHGRCRIDLRHRS